MSQPVRFDNRVAIVTGSGRGLGREHALLLGQLGANVVVNSMTPATAEKTTNDIIAAGSKAVYQLGSVADPAIATALVQKAIDTYGRIDILINNAGIAEIKPFETITQAEMKEMLNIHLEGSFNVTQAAWPHLQKQKYGRVVMISSHTIFGQPGGTTYVTAKLGLIGLAKCLAVEGAAYNINVNAVATSGYTDNVEKAVTDENAKDIIMNYMPASDPAKMVAWLSHEDCKATGEAFGAQGRVATKLILAETQGYQGPRSDDWTVETIRDHWDEITAEKDYNSYASVDDVAKVLFGRIVEK